MSLEIVLLGPPGTGKGTHASYLIKEYLIPHISTGDMLRDNLHHNTDLGIEAKSFMDQGDLVPDSLVTRMVKKRLSEPDALKGFLLDGYPRTVHQAVTFDEVLDQLKRNLKIVLYIDSSEKLIIQRLTGRRVCLECSKIYNMKNFPPKIDGKCDECGSPVVQREDDTESTVLKRLEIYHAQTEDLIEYYQKFGLLKRIDGDLPISETQAQIRSELKNFLV